MSSAFVRYLSIVTLFASTMSGSICPALAQGQKTRKRTKPPSVNPALVARLEADVPKLLAEHNVPGCSMTLIRGGETVWNYTFGSRRSDRNSPVTERTVFEAASMSKPLFAYAALKLVDEGKLGLDRSLDSYLPEPYLPDQPDSVKVTARMVLTHTTGFPNWRRGKPLTLNAQPGTQFTYSGEGFVYLQRVVEHLVGQGLDRWMKEQLLAPLSMNRSSFIWQKSLADDFAGGHDQDGNFKEGRRMYSKANAAYTLYTTPKDYAKFLLEIIRSDSNQRHSLKLAMLREMLTDQPVPGNYGLGWKISGPDGFVSHEGSNGTGFRCHCRFHQTGGDGVVIMTNGVNGAAVCKAVLEIIDGDGDVPEAASVGGFPGEQWNPAGPSRMLRWSESRLAEARDYWMSLGSTAAMIVEDGDVVQAWGDVERPIQCYSVRKSFLSALYGVYKEKGMINLSATMAELEIDDVAKLTPDEKKATVHDLLKARSGIYHAAAYETASMKDRRPKRGSHPHGTFWYYNNWDFNALGGIFEQQTGLSVFEGFKKDIAVPIGMNDFSERCTKFVFDRKSSRFPAYTFSMSTRDRARFGLLCLRNGNWSGNQLIPSTWISESTRAWSKTGPGVGYGYMWWVSVDGWHFGNRFKGKPYSARGNHGQYIVVVPEMQLVVVQSVDNRAGDKMTENKSFNTLLKLILAARKNQKA